MRDLFIDTSVLYALLDRDDQNHLKAAALFVEVLQQGIPLQTHSFVLLETIALLQNRLGLAAVIAFREDLQGLLTIEWIASPLYEEAMQQLIASEKKGVSLVDHVSFLLMRQKGIKKALAFDSDFTMAGFEIVAK